MLDHLTRGRIVSGFVRGIGWEYFDARASSPTHSRERFNEAHDLIIKAWTSTEPFEWVGASTTSSATSTSGRGRCRSRTRRSTSRAPAARETMKYCAEKRYTFMSVYAPTPVVKRWFDGYRAAAGELGYEPDPEKIGLRDPDLRGRDATSRRTREARPHVEWLFHKGLKQGLEASCRPATCR